MLNTRNTFRIYAVCVLAGIGGFFAAVHTVSADNAASHGFPHALLYVTSSKTSLESLRAHITAVDIVAPQTYSLKADGTFLGSPNPNILKIVHDSGAELMPLVVNQHFDPKLMHAFLTSDAAQNKFLTSIVAEAKKQGYIGFQYDFEHMPAEDRDLYTSFVAKSAPIFHADNLQLSVAVAPKHSDFIADYGAGSWEHWTGAFDYAAIGASADFISVMAYDDSKSVGPVASYPWVKSVVEYTLARVPADKVSLGVAFYGWARNAKTGNIDHIVTYPDVAALLSSGKGVISQGWSNDLGSSYAVYTKNKKIFTVWYEDQKSFEQKLSLVTGKKLRGFSAWAIGQEDPANWQTLALSRNLSPAPGELAMR